MLPLLLALLIPPPVPPPPPERVAAAAEALRLAPMPPSIETQLREAAISTTVYAAFAAPTADHGWIEPLRRRLADRIAHSERYAGGVQRCVVDAVGWSYDLPTLQSIAQVVRTPGGRALWIAALIEPERQCHRETLFEEMGGTGLTAAVQWLARVRSQRPLPGYDPAHDTSAQLAERLTEFCGASTRGQLVARGERLSVSAAWADRRRNAAAFACLLHSARLAGADVTETLSDGSDATIIGAS